MGVGIKSDHPYLWLITTQKWLCGPEIRGEAVCEAASA